jgi:hypothetical protein
MFWQSILAVLLILLLPAMATEKPKSKPAPRPYERDIVLTEEQGTNLLPSRRAKSVC